MNLETVWKKIKDEGKRFFPVFRYLFLQTETHAFCAALAFFAFLVFYPLSFVLLSFAKYAMKWDFAYGFLITALIEYYPISHDFLIRNLEASVTNYGGRLQAKSVLWILLGSAGLFIPIETALNRIWDFGQNRPYWKNQIVGFFVTVTCFLMAILFVITTTMLQSLMAWILPQFLEGAINHLVFKLAAICFTTSIIFLLYKCMPNGSVGMDQVLPAAVFAGFVGEVVRNVYFWTLPLLDFEKTQGLYYVSASFLIFVYVEAFVFLGGAYLAKDLPADVWRKPIWLIKEKISQLERR